MRRTVASRWGCKISFGVTALLSKNRYAATVSPQPSLAALMLASGLAAKASRRCLLRLFKRSSPKWIPASSSAIASDIVALHADLAGEKVFTTQGENAVPLEWNSG